MPESLPTSLPVPGSPPSSSSRVAPTAPGLVGARAPRRRPRRVVAAPGHAEAVQPWHNMLAPDLGSDTGAPRRRGARARRPCLEHSRHAGAPSRTDPPGGRPSWAPHPGARRLGVRGVPEQSRRGRQRFRGAAVEAEGGAELRAGGVRGLRPQRGAGEPEGVRGAIRRSARRSSWIVITMRCHRERRPGSGAVEVVVVAPGQLGAVEVAARSPDGGPRSALGGCLDRSPPRRLPRARPRRRGARPRPWPSLHAQRHRAPRSSG